MKIKKIIYVAKNLFFPPKVCLDNIFKTNFSKKVLISYLTGPFVREMSKSNSNYLESIKIAEIFHQQKYQVDVMQYNAKFKNIKFKNQNYNLVFGLEPNFLMAVDRFHPKESIYYATGAHYLFQNQAEKKRLENLYQRKNFRLRQIRRVQVHDSSSFADAVICIGNDWTKSTYKNHVKQIEMINVSAYSFFPYPKIKKEKNWAEARKNFLWFGSYGAVHKGLDLLLEIFPKHPELNLYICGGIENEEGFVKLYHRELYQTINIHFIGWVNPDSDRFKNLMLKCGYSILPSCSEGMSGAVATTMHSGLIPVVTKETGLDIKDCGIILKDASLEEIEKVILSFKYKSISWYKKMAQKAYEQAQRDFTLDKFTQDFKRALEKIL
jgi:glycosyltransferase involved in cell wall biosynthesis